MKNNNRSFPKIVNYYLEEEHNRVARNVARSYKDSIYPILFRFRLLDDEHIRKYLGCTTAEEIYKDAMEENKEYMDFLYMEADFKNEDIWKIIRDESSPVKKPNEEGFVFRKLPGSDYRHRELIVKSLSVDNREIQINEDILQAGSVVVPSEKQRELYNIVADFCDELKSKGFSKRNVGELLLNQYNTGRIIPNLGGILGLVTFYEKK